MIRRFALPHLFVVTLGSLVVAGLELIVVTHVARGRLLLRSKIFSQRLNHVLFSSLK